MKSVSRREFIKATAGIAALVAGLALSSCVPPVGNLVPGKRPNIILIMADDMGFSDIGCYGSEIQTPVLDKLASDGVKFTQFYNAARCCPSRASLLTGLYPHQTGVGHMTRDYEKPAYTGDLNNSCVTIAEALGSSGFTSGRGVSRPCSRAMTRSTLPSTAVVGNPKAIAAIAPAV